MNRTSSALVLGAVVAFGILTGISGQQPGGNPEAKTLKNPVHTSAQSIATGKQIYAKNCSGCHGVDAKGNGPMAPKDVHPSNLTDQEWTRGASDGEIFAVIRDGAGPKFVMHGYKSRLTDQDMWSIV